MLTLFEAALHRPSGSVENVDVSPPAVRDSRKWDDAQAVLEERGVLEPGVEQMGWHALRRKFASDLRDLPLKDLADLGGWRQTRTITECYLTLDEERMVAALERRGGSGD